MFTPFSALSSSPIFYSPDFEQALMDEFLPNCPSRAEFLASPDHCFAPSSSSMDSEAQNIDEENGNDPEIIFYSSDFEQALMDRFLPGCRSRSEFMAEGSSSDYAEDVNADFTPNDSTDCSSSSSSTSTPTPTRVLSTINGLATGLRLNLSKNGQKSGKIRRRGHRGGAKKHRKNAQANKENRIRII